MSTKTFTDSEKGMFLVLVKVLERRGARVTIDNDNNTVVAYYQGKNVAQWFANSGWMDIHAHALAISHRNDEDKRTKRNQVYAVIDGERDYQDAMAEKAHGNPSNDSKKSLEQFVLYMDDYLDVMKHQLSTVWGPGAYEEPLHTLRKVLAIGVSAMEVHGAPARIAPTKHEKGTDLT